MVKKSFLLVLLVILLPNGGVLARKLPSFIKACHQLDPQFNECLKRTAEELKPRLLDGIPELLIPPMNPLKLPLASLKAGTFSANFTNIEIYHLAEFVQELINVTISDNLFDIRLRFPKLRIKADYNLEGQLLFLKLKGSGRTDTNYTNMGSHLEMHGFRYKKGGRTYLGVKSKKLELDLGKPKLFFDRLFGDNTELNDRTNEIINENVVDILEEIRPVIYDTVSGIMFGTVGRIFTKFSFEELFPK